MPAAEDEQQRHETQVGDLPEACLSQVLALTSPRDAARAAAVSPAFRAAADSDHVWQAFLPFPLTITPDLLLLLPLPPPPTTTKKRKKKEAYLDLCDAGALLLLNDGGDGGGGGGSVKVWLEKATGARCYALSARRLSLPWDDAGESTWRWTPPPHPLTSRFADVAELVSDCTCLEIYAALPASFLTPATTYAAFLVYATAAAAPEEGGGGGGGGGGGHRGLSYPDQETAVAVGGRVVARHRVCLRPDEDAARRFWDVAAAAAAAAAAVAGGEVGGEVVEVVARRRREEVREPRVREDGWWEMEMGTVVVGSGDGEEGDDEEVVASFEVLGWYPKRGLIVESVEFRPLRC